jgi:hypothetical protein
MPLWWTSFMLWLDSVTIPLWAVLLVATLYGLVILWRDVSRALKSPPSRD